MVMNDLLSAGRTSRLYRSLVRDKKIAAAAMGIPVRRIFLVTILPNFLVATIYSVAADDSATTAIVTFLVTMVVSYVIWRVFGRAESKPAR